MKHRLVIALLLAALTVPVALRAAEDGSTPANTGADPTPAKDDEKARREKEKLQRQEDELNKAWSALSVGDKRNALDWYRGLAQLPGTEQRSIRERLDRYSKMSKEDREQLERNYEKWAKMTPAERERARQEYLRLRYEYETKWRKDHPNEPPPPFKLAAPKPATTSTNAPATK